MKFKLQINKISNKFHFINNLTEWHFSARKRYNKSWLKKTGRLTKKEEKALKTFTRILKKYNFGKKFLGIPFISNEEKNIWQEVEKWVNEKEFTEIKSVFGVFDERFDKIWKSEKRKLEPGKLAIEKALNDKKIRQILKNGAVFLRSRKLPPLITIDCLMGMPESIGGGANSGRNSITIEFSGNNKKYIQRILVVILHEVLHLYSSHSRYYQRSIRSISEKISKLAKQKFKGSGINGYVVINEAIVESWLPLGYVDTKYFLNLSDKKALDFIETKIKKAKNKFLKWRAFSAKELYFLTKDYFENKKPIDKKFFEEVEALFKKF